MSAKAIFLIAQALLIQTALSQCTNRAAIAAGQGLGPYGLTAPALAPAITYDGLATGWTGNGIAYNGLASGCRGNNFAVPAIEITPTSGGALPVSSVSAIPPNGVAVASENMFEGALSVAGELPFVGTVGLEGVVPSAGVGAVNHACGNGATRMISENGAAVSKGVASGIGNLYGRGIGAAISPAAPFGYGTGLAGLAYPGAYPASGCGAGLAPYGGAIGLGAYGGALAPAAYGAGAAYGGAGEGNVAVIGELPVYGNTAVAGQVPISGIVNFNGAVPAAGTVSITGTCACGCGSSYLY